MTNKEYTITITCNGGMPYNLCIFKSFNEAMQSLNNMISLEKERHRPYYVFNDFYENEYPASLNCKIFCLKVRNVSDWEKYLDNSSFENSYNNVYQFPNKFFQNYT